MNCDSFTDTVTITLYGLRDGRKITAIKGLRAIASLEGQTLGLKPAKALVDNIERRAIVVVVRRHEEGIARMALGEGFNLYAPQQDKAYLADHFDERDNAPTPYNSTFDDC